MIIVCILCIALTVAAVMLIAAARALHMARANLAESERVLAWARAEHAKASRSALEVAA